MKIESFISLYLCTFKVVHTWASTTNVWLYNEILKLRKGHLIFLWFVGFYSSGEECVTS